MLCVSRDDRGPALDQKWLDELDELRVAVRDLTVRLAAAELAREQQDTALAMAIAQHPANGPEPISRSRKAPHLRLLRALALKARTPGSEAIFRRGCGDSQRAPARRVRVSG